VPAGLELLAGWETLVGWWPEALAGAGSAQAAPFWDSIAHWWHAVNEAVMALAGSPWALVACFALAMIDGFFPPVPAETLIIATAAVFASSHQWWPGLVLWVVAAGGALCGDSVAFALGRWFDAPNWGVFRRGKGQAAMEWAGRLFGRGAAPLLIVARFIPVGRVAVNLTAGTVGYPYRRFVLVDSAAALCWAAYSVGIGYVAGKVTGENPLLGVVMGVAFSATVGVGVQWLMNRHYGKPGGAGVAADPAASGGVAGAIDPDGAADPPTPNER
jgi:membrane protein DedA with SNARE-associated domain